MKFQYKNVIKITTLITSVILYNTISKAEEFEIDNKSLFVPARIGKVAVTHDEEGFHVKKNNVRHDIKPYWLSPSLRDINDEQLKSFLKQGGYLSINQLDNEEFTLKDNVRGLGGDPAFDLLALAAGTIIVTACVIESDVPDEVIKALCVVQNLIRRATFPPTL